MPPLHAIAIAPSYHPPRRGRSPPADPRRSPPESNARLHGLRHLDVAASVLCPMPMPIKDSPNQITEMVAAHVLFELTSLIADRLASFG